MGDAAQMDAVAATWLAFAGAKMYAFLALLVGLTWLYKEHRWRVRFLAGAPRMLIDDAEGQKRFVLVVTGGNRGVGRSIVAAVTGALKAGGGTGATVVLCARSKSDGEAVSAAVARACGALSRDGKPTSIAVRVVSAALDITSEQSVGDFAAWCEAQYGHVDVLVNNAVRSVREQQSVAQYRRVAPDRSE